MPDRREGTIGDGQAELEDRGPVAALVFGLRQRSACCRRQLGRIRQESLLAAAPSRVVASFYRTAAGAEIDLPKRGRWAVEIKRRLAPKLWKGFHLACGDLKPARRFVVFVKVRLEECPGR